MSTDKETAQQIEIRKALNKIVRDKGADGCYLFTFWHTDSTKNMDTHCVGKAPPLDEVAIALITLIATQAYTQGKEDLLAELSKKVDDQSCIHDGAADPLSKL